MKPSILFLVLIVMLLLLTFAVLPPSASANHSWNGYHWARTSNPFRLALGSNLSNGWGTYLNAASTDWTQSAVLDTVVIGGQTGQRRCRPTAGRVEVCNYRYGNNGWLGLAQIWISGSHILQGVVKVNDTYFSQTRYNYTTEKQHVMCQEVGHTLGLGHQDESGASLNTCMDYYYNTSNSDTRSIHPNQHDYDQLAQIYSHLDSTTTIGSMPASMANEDFDTPEKWGKIVSAARSGRTSVFERDFGNGFRILTRVTHAQ